MNSAIARGMRVGPALALSVVSALLLGGCSNAEDQLYEAFKCGKVATLLEREQDGDMALQNAAPYMREMEAQGGNPGQVAMEMNQRFQDDVPLYRLTVGGQMAVLSQIYQSEECQTLYKSPSGVADANEGSGSVTKAGMVNMAGCPVPEGISWEEAERITC